MKRSTARSHFLTLYKRGYLRDHIIRIMHLEGYDVSTRELREWFKNAPESARAERKLALRLIRGKKINQKYRMQGYLYRRYYYSRPDLQEIWADMVDRYVGG